MNHHRYSRFNSLNSALSLIIITLKQRLIQSSKTSLRKSILVTALKILKGVHHSRGTITDTLHQIDISLEDLNPIVGEETIIDLFIKMKIGEEGLKNIPQGTRDIPHSICQTNMIKGIIIIRSKSSG